MLASLPTNRGWCVGMFQRSYRTIFSPLYIFRAILIHSKEDVADYNALLDL